MMVAWKRFPVPEFDYQQFAGLAYEPPRLYSPDELAALTAKLENGDETVCGGYGVALSPELVALYRLEGEASHAIVALLPAKPVHLLGRSHAWRLQRALILARSDASTATVLHDWKTTRPMTTRLGPDDGATLPGGSCLIVTGNKYAEHWLCNRSIIQNDWDPGDGRKGFRMLAGSDPSKNNFHDCCLTFDWSS